MPDWVMRYVLMGGWSNENPVCVFADEADARVAAETTGDWYATVPVLPAGARLPAQVPVYCSFIAWSEQEQRYEAETPDVMHQWPWEPMPGHHDRVCFGADPQAAYAAGRERATALTAARRG